MHRPPADLHDAMHSVDDLRFVEVDQKSQRACSQFQVRQQLRFVHWKHRRDRFHFDDHAILDYQVDPVSRVESRAFVDDRNREFTYVAQFAIVEFGLEALGVGRFQKTWAQDSVHFDCGANDLASCEVDSGFDEHAVERANVAPG